MHVYVSGVDSKLQNELEFLLIETPTPIESYDCSKINYGNLLDLLCILPHRIATQNHFMYISMEKSYQAQC